MSDDVNGFMMRACMDGVYCIINLLVWVIGVLSDLFLA
jgi:hypothetical protein